MITEHKDFLIKEVPIGDEINLIIKSEIKNGTIQQFSIVFRKKIDGYWHTVMRCDNSKKHDESPHCHYLKHRGEEQIIYLGTKDDNMEHIIQEIINNINRRYKKIVENYQFSR